MRFRARARPPLGVALAAASLMVVAGCRGSSPPSPGTSSPVPGVISVGGSQRLLWNQAGDTSILRFRAYVDGQPVALDATTCKGATLQAECTSPLPPLSDGVHTIALTSVSTLSGLESAQSSLITVQKVSTRASTRATSLPDAGAGTGSVRLEPVGAASEGLTFAVDIVARGLKAPAQLAWAPDGRLFIADADGRVRVIRPGQRDHDERMLALDAHTLLEPPPLGPPGLALHPDFPRNHFVYLSFLAHGAPERTLLRIIRLREVGDTLGEPATLFEAPLTLAGSKGQRETSDRLEAGSPSALVVDGPRLAFGPDRLLYVALPPGVEFDDEPSASAPSASMLRLRDDGRVPDVGPLSGINAHPLGFAWHPSTAALLVVFPAQNGEAVLQPITGVRPSSVAETERVVLRMTAVDGRLPGALTFPRSESDTLELTSAFVAGIENDSLGTVRLAAPILVEDLAGVSGRIGDVVAGNGGTFFLATRDGEGPEGGGAGADVVVRLTPRQP